MFTFIKYIQPANYYQLIDNMPQSILVVDESVDKTIGYRDDNSAIMDNAYLNLQQGFIPTDDNQRATIQNYRINCIHDNYIFIRRYFSKFQVYWVLLLRLLSFHNPIKELGGFIKSRKHRRITLKPVEYLGYEKFESNLIKKGTVISVIIPTLNRYKYLKDVLGDLEKQSYKNFEVVVCDQSEPVDETFYKNWNLNIQLIQQEEKALWLARNRSIQSSKGDYILLFDDDSRVESNWIESHLKCIEYFDVKISAGVTHTLVGSGLGKKDKYFHLSDVFDTGNAMVHRSVFHSVGLFDRQFEKQRMGDAEFGLRSLLGGFLVVSNPYAKRIHLKVETGGLRQMGSWDAFRPKNLFSPRPIPSVLYLTRKYFGSNRAFLYILKNIPQSFVPYKFKGNKSVRWMVILFLPIWLLIAIIAVLKSWKLASDKLYKGDLIEYLAT